MPIYEFSQTDIVALKGTAFSSMGVHERRDLQRLLRDNVEVIAPETLVISEEFAVRLGWSTVAVFRDEGFSGTGQAQLPSAQPDMLSALASECTH